jgi:NADPH-dependent 2,4-dienoyl-CoA reductase/sulfur reductase-like enzyme
VRRYVVVGNGPAGASAAFAARDRYAEADITIVGGEDVPFYSRPGLAYLLTGWVPERQLFSRPDRLYQEARIRRLVATVTAVEPALHRVVLADGRTLPYDRLLLATGSKATLPDLPGIDLPGVVTLDSYGGTRDIIRLAAKARRACVVGGGITALELAEGLAARGVETHYLMRGDRYWSNVLDPAESERVEHHLAADGIRLRKGTELDAVLERRGRVAAVRTRDGETITCEILGVAIGVLPRVELAAAAGIPVNRGILVSETFEADLPDVLAAGDCSEVLDPATGKRSIDTLWSIANDQGRVAGHNLAGVRTPYSRPAPFNVTRIGGITTTIIGQVGTGGRDVDLVSLSRGDSFAWREQLGDFAVAAAEGDSRLRLVLGPDRIAGAIVMGNQALSRPLQHLVRERVDISAVRDRLLDGSGDLRTLLLSLATGVMPA